MLRSTFSRVSCLINKKSLSKLVVPSFSTDASYDNSDQPKYMVEPSRSVFIRNLPFSLQKTEMDFLLGKIGEVSHSILMRRSGGESKGQAIVEFSTEEGAASAVSLLDGKDVEGRQIFVSMFQKGLGQRERRSFGNNKHTVFIANLPVTSEGDEEDLSNLFETSEGFLKLSAPKGKTFAFADFETEEQAEEAIANLNGSRFGGNNIVMRHSNKD